MSASDVLIRILGESKQARDEIDKTKTDAKSLGDVASASGKKLTTRFTLPLLGAGAAAVKLAGDQEEAERKVAATVDSMGASVWTSVDALKAQAAAFQETSTFGDEAILGYQDLLLTFGNVKNEIGEGNDIFTRSTQLGLDMSTALGQDLKSSAIQLGKALNDPITGVTALSRVGVSFTEQQKEQIKTLVESGDTLGAQKLILGELEKQFGGTAQAVAQTSQGQMKQAMNALGDAAESVGEILVPVVREMASFLKGLADRFQSLSPQTKEMIVRIAGLAAVIGPVLVIGAKAVSMFKTIGTAFSVLSKLLMANPWALLIAATVALVVLVVQNWDKIVAAIKAAWDWIKNAAGQVWEAITSAFQKAVDFVKDLFLNFTPLGLIIQHFDKIKEVATGVKDWIVEKFDAVVNFFKELPGRISSAVTGLWDGLKDAFRSAINWIIDKWNGLSLTIGPLSIPDWIPGIGGKSIQMSLNTPNIPRLHGGGIFRTSDPSGEGLALLRNEEEVITPEQRMMSKPGEQITNVFVLDWNDFVRHVRKASVEGGRLGL